MDNHMKNDVRVLWSLDQLGIDPNAWFRVSDAWIAGGMQCQ
jgi:hypothetical protein